ncbi:MAG: ATP-binding protein [Acidobacteria bacterium]|nr:ATP-binding protein [Acidobacteriota bacterium]
MLVAFALTNRACFRDRQELSMEAVGRTADRFAFGTGVRQAPRLNRVAAIYGPNGGGKSRLVQGLAFAREFVLNSSKEGQAGEEIAHLPFLFDEVSRNSPTVLETAFIHDGSMYEYGFSLDRKRVHREWLLAWPPGGRMRRLLDRFLDPETGEPDCEFGPSVRGPKSLWRDSTRPNALLVSTAVQLNSETFRPVVDWFRRLRIVDTDGLPPNFTGSDIAESEAYRKRVLGFLKAADISVADVDVDKVETPLEELKEILPPAIYTRFAKDSETIEGMKLRLVHKPSDGDPQALDLEEESDGTQRYFSFAGPWLRSREHDLVVVVDELDRSLHPHLVASLVRHFNQQTDDGDSKAQLIATLHEVTLLQKDLDRGQVWLTQKERKTEAAYLKPVSDYRPRPDEALMRGYLGGRYGGVPVVIAPEPRG